MVCVVVSEEQELDPNLKWIGIVVVVAAVVVVVRARRGEAAAGDIVEGWTGSPRVGKSVRSWSNVKGACKCSFSM